MAARRIGQRLYRRPVADPEVLPRKTFLRASELTEYFGVDDQTIRKWARNGELPVSPHAKGPAKFSWSRMVALSTDPDVPEPPARTVRLSSPGVRTKTRV